MQTDTKLNEGVVERDGYKLNWVREGEGIPMLVVGSLVYYRRLGHTPLGAGRSTVAARNNHQVATWTAVLPRPEAGSGLRGQSTTTKRR